MRSSRLRSLSLAVCLSVTCAASAAEDDFTLFDGKTFAGWEGNLEMFRIEEGAIVGRNLEREIPHNEFLCTTREYSDFELRMSVKVKGEGVNAGIQIRNTRKPDKRLSVC